MTAQTATIPAPTKTNGVDVDYVMGVIDQVKGNPEIAKFQFRASNQWIDGGHNRSTVKEFYGACQEDDTRTEPFIMEADEPPILAGNDKAPNPVEFVLHGLASCLTTTLAYHAAVRGIEIDSISSEMEGDLD
ncbi:MAG: OsmC family protein, partial [Proteobacteria bacterium]|nr:OsmC family protein [Pseudomonadota bacterium]